MHVSMQGGRALGRGLRRRDGRSVGTAAGHEEDGGWDEGEDRPATLMERCEPRCRIPRS